MSLAKVPRRVTKRMTGSGGSGWRVWRGGYALGGSRGPQRERPRRELLGREEPGREETGREQPWRAEPGREGNGRSDYYLCTV